MATAYHSQSSSGSFTKFSSTTFEGDFRVWLTSLEELFQISLEQLSVKVLISAFDVPRLQKIVPATILAKWTIAQFHPEDPQDCFFYSESGRLRVAPQEESDEQDLPASTDRLRQSKGISAHHSADRAISKTSETGTAKAMKPSTQNADKKTMRAAVNATYDARKSGAAEVKKSSPVTSPRARAKFHDDPTRKIRVLIVDDSKTIRQILRKIIEASDRLVVAGEVDRPSLVEKALDDLKPDVMTLDIRMPEMTGVELIRKMFLTRFIPTIMISSLSIDEGHEVLDALEIGAIDYIQKPEAKEILSLTPLIHEKLISAAGVRARKKFVSTRQALAPAKATGPSDLPPSIKRGPATRSFLAVGASTGGTEAIKSIFTRLPANIPPIAIVQHIPAHFSAAFAKRLNELCRFEVREAKDGDLFLPGLALIAPGGQHLEVVKDGSKLVARITDGPAVNRFKPSVDVLFHSVAKILGDKATGVILTGMGSDGAQGLMAMRSAGAFTIGQDEESCVVYGMPRVALEVGAVQLVRALDDIASAILA